MPVLLVLTSGSTRGTNGRKLVVIVVPRAVMIWLPLCDPFVAVLGDA